MLKIKKRYLTGVLLITLFLWAIVFYINPVLFSPNGEKNTNELLFFFTRMLIWISLALLYVYTRYIEKQPLLIWKEKTYKPLFYIVSVILIVIISYIGYALITVIIQQLTHEKPSAKLLQYISLFKTNFFLLLLTTLTAAIVEEFIFRGYIQARLEVVFKSPTIAIVVSALLFGIMHSPYGTLSQIFGPVYIGLFFSWVYYKYRNIKILIICHFLIDTISLLALTKLSH